MADAVVKQVKRSVGQRRRRGVMTINCSLETAESTNPWLDVLFFWRRLTLDHSLCYGKSFTLNIVRQLGDNQVEPIKVLTASTSSFAKGKLRSLAASGAAIGIGDAEAKRLSSKT
jgi:hypothetical protein